MQLRPYRTADCAELAALFFNTVHTVNAKDYTPVQLDAWADGQVDLAAWDKSFLAHRTLVAGARGYRVVRAQQVERHGVLLTNFVMEKPAPPAAD